MYLPIYTAFILLSKKCIMFYIKGIIIKTISKHYYTKL